MKTNFAMECLCWAEKTPDNPAIHSVERGTFSYRWLLEQAKRFGNVLKRLGVNKGDRYACVLPNIPEAAVVFLGGQLIGSVPVTVFIGYKERGSSKINLKETKLPPARTIEKYHYLRKKDRKFIDTSRLDGFPRRFMRRTTLRRPGPVSLGRHNKREKAGDDREKGDYLVSLTSPQRIDSGGIGLMFSTVPNLRDFHTERPRQGMAISRLSGGSLL